jgi:acylphosphatase
MRCVRIVVRGRVQGVFFRASAARLARELQLAGSVSNRPDGAVEAIVAGDPESVERMIAWCRRGPELAEVDSVEVSEEPGAEQEQAAGAGFHIS